MSTYPSTTHAASRPYANESSLDAAVDGLAATLYGARTRSAIAWLALLGMVTYAPLALASRNGWAFGALLALEAACIARWVAAWLVERERSTGQPALILILHAVIGTAWTVTGVVTIAEPHGYGTALVLVASAVVCAASIPMFEGHRDACWWLMAPMALLPAALPFTAPEWSLPLAATCLVGLAAAAWQAHRAQHTAIDHRSATLRAKALAAQHKHEQQAGASATAQLDARDRDLGLLVEHAGIGVARVNGYAIEAINAPLERLLGTSLQQRPRRDVMSLFKKDYHAAIDAAIKRKAKQTAAPATQAQGGPTAQATTAAAHAAHTALRVELAADAHAARRWVDVVVPAQDGDGARLWLVLETTDPAPTTQTSGAQAAPAPHSGVLDRIGLERRLQAHAAKREHVTVVNVALAGLTGVSDVHGDVATEQVRKTVTQRLAAVCRADGDAVAVLDEACFAVLLTGEVTDLSLSLLSDRVHSAMTTPHTIDATTLQLGVQVEPLRCELDIHKATTALAQLDDFALQAREARRLEARTAALASPGSTVTTTSNTLSTVAAAVSATANTTQQQQQQHAPWRHAAPRSSREDAEIAGATKPLSRVVQVAAPLSIETIHIEPDPDDEA